MTASFPPSAPNVGRFTAVILGFVVFVCVAMIGGTGYLKYQLDRSEILLAAPDAAVGSDQDMFDRLRRDLGYGGFLGLAQNYVIGHDASGFAEMKAQIKSADDIVAHLPDKTPAETRHDLTAIVASFDAVMQRISASAGEVPEVTVNDLAPLYAALPVLDARVAASNGETRLAAQGKMQFWAMLLTLVSWCSLIIAAACAAGIYLTLRDKHSAPMRALAQSIQNMARGDMRTAIWGIERQDTIGELARSVDIARYHFSHLPDLSLLSEQGPVRMRFEGGSRSLFEAMMKAISRDSENIRQQTATLTETIEGQKAAMAQISEKVEAVLQNILQRGQNGDTQIKQAIHDMAASAENLKNAHAHAADQLNRMLPYVQDRVQGMAEIAAITGKQVAQTLQALTLSEMGLKANAEQTKDTLARLSSTADDLGERMFGAINLLQAGGKVLAETTEKIGQKLLHSDSGAVISPAAVWDADALQPLAARIDRVAAQLADMQNHAARSKNNAAPDIEAVLAQIKAKLDGIGAAIQPPPAQNDSGEQTALLLSGISQLLADHIEPALAAIAARLDSDQETRRQQDNIANDATRSLHVQMRDELAAIGDKMAALSAALPAGVRDALQPDWQRISARIDAGETAIGQKIEQQNRATIVQLLDASAAARDALPVLAEKLSGVEPKLAALENGLNGHFQEKFALVADKVTALFAALPADLRQALQPDWQHLAARMESAETAIGQKVEQQTRSVVVQLLDASAATRDALPVLAEKLSGVEPKLAALENGLSGHFQQTLALVADKIAALSAALPTDVSKALQEDWQHLAARVEAAETAIGQKVEQQGRAVVVQLLDASAATREALPILASTLSGVEPKLAALENGLNGHFQQTLTLVADKILGLSASLPVDLRQALQPDWQHLAARIDESETAIDRKVEQQGRAVIIQTMDATNAARDALREIAEKIAGIEQNLPPGLHQIMKDQWCQIAAQIEASRANVENLFETKVAAKIDSFEQSLQPTRDVIDAARRAIENPPRPSLTFPPELQKQLSDQWFQIAAQIEATRADVVASVSHQIELLENRLSDKRPGGDLTRTASDYGSQRQFEQQTQILSELVATLGILDAHMQQIKSEIHARA